MKIYCSEKFGYFTIKDNVLCEIPLVKEGIVDLNVDSIPVDYVFGIKDKDVPEIREIDSKLRKEVPTSITQELYWTNINGNKILDEEFILKEFKRKLKEVK